MAALQLCSLSCPLAFTIHFDPAALCYTLSSLTTSSALSDVVHEPKLERFILIPLH
jgi:hypothetical protein